MATDKSERWLPFEEARTFVRELGLKSKEEWSAWCKSGKKPHNIPCTPATVYKDIGWITWGDWLGTGSIRPKDCVFLSFEEARAFVRNLGLRNQTEWSAWLRTDKRPKNIPSAPRDVYRNEGWIDLGDWLGTGTKASQSITYLPFEQARDYVQRQCLSSKDAWVTWVREGNKPDNIPSNPQNTYRDSGWTTWGNWLGTGSVAKHRRLFLPFEEARAYVRGLGLKSRAEWNKWCQSKNRPPEIPTAPHDVYKDCGWDSYGDWLGTGTIAPFNRIYLPFEEARAYVRTLGLRGTEEWTEWAKSGLKPANIPANARGVYKDSGWIDWYDWLGTASPWTRNAIISFLRDLLPQVDICDPSEQHRMMCQEDLLDAARNTRNSNRHVIGKIAKLALMGDRHGLKEAINDALRQADEHAQKGEEVIAGPEDEDDVDLDAEIPAGALPDLAADGTLDAMAEREDALPALLPSKTLEATDFLVQRAGSDAEACEFFVCNAVGKLWRQYLRDEAGFDLEDLLRYPAGEYGSRVRERFLEQLNGARSLPLPDGYRSYEPNTMQRLIAYRLLTERRLGNWSGTGAGKTLGAILASRVVGANLTVVVGLNSTIEDEEHGWADEIHRAFPHAHVIVKERGALAIDPNVPTFLLLNFEAFQQPDAVAMIRRLVEDHHIDTVVLDEIQAAKQRDKDESERRKMLVALLSAASKKNPDLCVLGMSATPVINNLQEAKSLLEMIRGYRFDDLKTRPTVTNVMALHEKLVVHGIRWKPRYSITLNPPQYPEIAGDHLKDEIAGIGRVKNNILRIEQSILPAKLPAIVAATQPGTLIYSQFVEGMVPQIVAAVRQAGYSVATYVSNDRREDGLNAFCKGTVDVLVASEKIQQGVDGLQERCNRLVIACPPWTGAGFEQLVGRIYRQGSRFDSVDVVIPQVVIPTDTDTWSYDQWRYERIVSKKTLADATVDGKIPTALLETPQAMLARSLEALQGWIKRLEEQGLAPAIERPVLQVPLPADKRQTALRTFGDFAHMNARWSTANSATTHARLSADPTEWELYHTLYREARASWPEVPYETFTAWLQSRIAAHPDWVVGDFGCGEALLAAALPNTTLHSFDHVASSERVTSCDMAHTPLADGVLDVAVFSLSLMGTNWRDYLAEAQRTLRLDGRLLIAEPCSRWEGDKHAELCAALAERGFRLIGGIEERGRFLYVDAIKSI